MIVRRFLFNIFYLFLYLFSFYNLLFLKELFYFIYSSFCFLLFNSIFFILILLCDNYFDFYIRLTLIYTFIRKFICISLNFLLNGIYCNLIIKFNLTYSAMDLIMSSFWRILLLLF